jgi:hypothetical protein
LLVDAALILLEDNTRTRAAVAAVAAAAAAAAKSDPAVVVQGRKVSAARDALAAPTAGLEPCTASFLRATTSGDADADVTAAATATTTTRPQLLARLAGPRIVVALP